MTVNPLRRVAMRYRRRLGYRRIFRDILVRPVKRFWQRGRRGWCDEDAWNINTWLSEMLPPLLDKMRADTHGWPGLPLMPEEWFDNGGVLDQIAQGFRAFLALDRMDWFERGEDIHGERAVVARENLEQTFKHGMELFVRWYGDLWD